MPPACTSHCNDECTRIQGNIKIPEIAFSLKIAHVKRSSAGRYKGHLPFQC